MNVKRMILVVALVAGATAAFAQKEGTTDKHDETVTFRPHWFMRVQGGVGYTLGENDFGKLHILPNGDIYANRHYPALGNTATHDFLTIIQKEIKEGCSWLRVRNQEPCTNCLYRDLCPSPSDYELEIGCPNLCYINH